MPIQNSKIPADIHGEHQPGRTCENRRIEGEGEAEELQAELDNVILRNMYDLNNEDVEVADEFLDVW
ncbi:MULTISPECIES: hypothetical protein [Haloarcula]|uniref:hypothetical protein n=1 Tax=Haloarcula TaxID=2237 RepID=UPI000F8EE007|nr:MULTISPECIES: hypothetical protein [Haloarcula]NHX38728.1 hypothetical protein [Haloarcula sp. R1-2]